MRYIAPLSDERTFLRGEVAPSKPPSPLVRQSENRITYKWTSSAKILTTSCIYETVLKL